jgi:hypothetical protein
MVAFTETQMPLSNYVQHFKEYNMLQFATINTEISHPFYGEFLANIKRENPPK